MVIEAADVTPGDPGHLTIDASVGGRIQILIPDATLKFEKRAEFVDFMVQNFNAEVAFDENNEPYWYTLHQTVLGDPLYFDGTDWLEAEDPVALMVGGRDGYVEIEGQLVCVNPSFCGLFETSGRASAMSSSLAMPAGTASYNYACGEFVCGETTILSWDWNGGFQKLKVKTSDRRWGRGYLYRCGWWFTPPVPTPKYCLAIDTYPNILTQLSTLFRLNECAWDQNHIPIAMPKEEGRNLKSIWEIYDRGGWYSRNPPVPSGLTWHQFWAPDYGQAEQVATSFNQYNQYNFDCRGR